MRTVAEIEKDIESTRGAYRAMADITDAEPEGKGIFLDNCGRRIAVLTKELEEAKRAEQKPDNA